MAKPYILVVRQLGGIGDVLMLSCVFRGLREKYKRHKIILATSQNYMAGSLIDLAEHNPYIDEIHNIEPFETTTKVTKQWWNQFAGTPDMEDSLFWQKADFAVDLNVACIDNENRQINTHGRVTEPRYKIWCDAAGVLPSSYAPIYRVTPAEALEARKYAEDNWQGKRVVGLGLTACDKKRAVGINTLHALCQGLVEAGCHPVTIDAVNRFEGVDGLYGKRIREIIPLIGQMAAVVSVDSGVLHMAGVVGTPVIGVFGPTDYRMRMGNYLGSAIDSECLTDCAPCWYSYPCQQQGHPHRFLECLDRIPAKMIIEETMRWVNGHYHNRHSVP